jgi:arylsulfatase
MDKSIGDLVDGLKKRAVLDNTLILFMSDNGGNAEAGPNGRSNGEPTMADSNWFCGESWAYVQNTPFRLYKHYNHEGGIASPLVVHWPAGINAKNELRSQPSHLIDIMATCVDVGGAEYPKQHNGHSITPLEGRSLRPAFENKSITRDALFWEHEGNAAVRVGDMKLVRQKAKGPWELYDLKSDRTEQHNLAEQQPGQVNALSEKWNAWAKRAYVTPSPKEAAQGNEDAEQPKKKKKGKAK